MSFENFLQFWSDHNRQIIEFVFVSTFVVILFVIYRQFFAKTESTAGAGSHGTPVSIDTSEIEEKLKKILENQGAFKTVAAEPAPITTTDGAPAAVAVNSQELEKLKNEIKQKEQAIEELKKASVANASAGAAGASKEDTKKFEDKIKELEGRLQEYEIISEDIADLSFYKEENARLQKELSAKAGAPVAAVAAVTEPVPTPAPIAAAPVEAAPEPTPAATATAEADAEAAAIAAAAEMAPVPAEASAPVDSVIDDDILKEFAAAVEGQKATEKEKKDAKAEAKAAAAASVAEPVADPAQPVDPQKLTESKELMGEFENFIKKG